MLKKSNLVEAKKLKINDFSNVLYSLQDKQYDAVGLLKPLEYALFESNKLLVHEKAYQKSSNFIYNDLKRCVTQKSPIILFHTSIKLDKLLKKQLNSSLEILHKENKDDSCLTLKKIREDKNLIQLEEEINNIDYFCVADGHHRLSALSKYYQNNQNIPNEQKLLFTLILHISSVRTTRQTLALKWNLFFLFDFFKILKKYFVCVKLSHSILPETSNSILMLYKGDWYILTYLEKVEINLYNKCVFKKHFLDNLSSESYTIVKENLLVKDINNFKLADYGLEDENTIVFFLPSDKPETVFNLAKEKRYAIQHSTCFLPKLAPEVIEYDLPY